MQIHFTGRNIEVTDALKTFTEEKLQRLERRHTNIENLFITFQIEHVTHTAEGTAHLDGIEIHASAQSDDMYKSVDDLVAKLLAQITKHQDKITEHR